MSGIELFTIGSMSVTLADVVTGVGALVSVGNTIAGGNAQAAIGAAQMQAANQRAAQLDQNAGQERAFGQRKAIEERRRARLAESRAIALTAGGGTATTDSGVQDIVGGIAQEGEFRALTAMFEGENTARGLEAQAIATRHEGALHNFAGQVRKRSSRRRAAGTILESGVSYMDRFAPSRSSNGTQILGSPTRKGVAYG